MRDQKQRLALAAKRLKELQNHALVGLVEVARRLVGDDDVGVVDECTRDADTLLLAAAKLARAVRDAVSEPYFLKCCLGAILVHAAVVVLI